MPKRFWRGKKRIAKKYTNTVTWKLLHDQGAPKVGDVTHDCTAFNEYITEVKFYHDPVHFYSWPKGQNKHRLRHLKKAKRVDLQCYYGPNAERLVCNCTGPGYQKPLSVEEIEKIFLAWDTPEDPEIFLSREMKQIIQALKAGEKVFDENGVRIHE